jgi:hypothetical protein
VVVFCSNAMQVIGSRRLSTESGDLVEAANREGKHELDLTTATMRMTIRQFLLPEQSL